MKENLCTNCSKADTTCPVYEPGMPTFECVEWVPVKDIQIDLYSKLALQNAE
jgi:hypothetical protein